MPWKTTRNEFEDYHDSLEYIDAGLARIEKVKEDLRSEDHKKPDSDDYYGKDSPGNDSNGSRSIFDDVDL